MNYHARLIETLQKFPHSYLKVGDYLYCKGDMGKLGWLLLNHQTISGYLRSFLLLTADLCCVHYVFIYLFFVKHLSLIILSPTILLLLYHTASLLTAAARFTRRFMSLRIRFKMWRPSICRT